MVFSSFLFFLLFLFLTEWDNDRNYKCVIGKWSEVNWAQLNLLGWESIHLSYVSLG